MNARLRIPEDLSRYAEGLEVLDVAAVDFEGALAEVITRYPNLRPRLIGSDGKLFSHLVVFANGKSVPMASLSQLVMTPGEEFEIMFLASGG